MLTSRCVPAKTSGISSWSVLLRQRVWDLQSAIHEPSVTDRCVFVASVADVESWLHANTRNASIALFDERKKHVQRGIFQKLMSQGHFSDF